MMNYVVLLRGINVGGKNKILMKELKSCLEESGFEQVITYIQSGNIIVQSALSPTEISSKIESLLSIHFTLDSSLIRTFVIDEFTYNDIIASAPKEFGKDNESYRYDVIFLMGVTSEQAMAEVETRDGVDTCWSSSHALFFRRPGPKNPDYTKSALSKIIKKEIYQSMTIRNWNTVTKLQNLLALRSKNP